MHTGQLTLQNVTRRYDDHVVLDDVTFSIRPDEKAGIIGDNGAGKSTLLRLIAGRDRADNGELTVVAPGGTGYLAQSLALPAGATVQDAVDAALAGLRELEARMRRAEAGLKGLAGAELAAALAEYAGLVARFEARAGYEADARVDIALHGLGLPGLDRDRPLSTLSGGERSRLALAATLASRPELLLLDEPTNHLSPSLVEELEGALAGFRGAVVVVTHDRRLRDRFDGRRLELDGGQVVKRKEAA